MADRRGGDRKCLILLGGSQASPYRRFDKSSLKVKMLGWLEVVA
jgi:hypothetical protein